jgi:tetratricopeptide (TPR) repeat protein
VANSEADFKALIKERKFAEAEALAQQRVAKDSKDDTAWWYLSRFGAGDEKKREALIPKLEKCIADLPMSAKCHHALGSVYGAAAQSAGMVNGIKYAGRIKDMFAKAVELDPANYDSRRDLNMFYLQAPGIVGGSVRKAFANADAHAKLNPAQGAILRAEAHAYDKEFEQAEKLLAGIKPVAGDDTTPGLLAQAWFGVGVAMISDKKAPAAVALFERRVAAEPMNAVLHAGLGRAQLETGAAEAAIASYEKALALDKSLNVHYRLGIAYQTKGDKAKALAALQQFMGTNPSGRAADDAKSRIEVLKKAA